MKAKDIRVGGIYVAKVSNKITRVRVDSIREATGSGGTRYDVTNLSTNRTTTFRSAAKFRSEAIQKTGTCVGEEKTYFDTPATEVEQRSDPTPADTAGEIRSDTTSVPTTVRAATTTLADHFRSREPKNTAPHLIVQARAGTGKTTTLISALQVLKGITPTITPSPQQQAVWDAVAQSKGIAQTVCFVAFNKSIASELQSRVPQGCEAMTMHSMGFKAVTKQFGRVQVESWVVTDIICELLNMHPKDARKYKGVVLLATEQLVSLCKMNLTDPSVDQLEQLSSYYDVDLNGSREEVFRLVPEVLEQCKNPRGKINFDDMIWLPVVLGLPVFQYDLLLVDEAQDLNRCQQALAKRAGKRLVLCGDPCQSIYGFAGADSQSMSRLQQELTDSPTGCTLLPLTVTRRCGKAIVEEAQKLVPDFEYHESNGAGSITTLLWDKKVAGNYREVAADGDMVLCRINAPLVSECFGFLKAGRKATIQGRDVGAGLTSLVKKLMKEQTERMAEGSIAVLVGKLSDWLAEETRKEQAKRNPSETRLSSLQDKHDCLVCFTEGLKYAEEVITRIESIFTDDKNAKGIRLSSIHRAKGLEAHRVFWLRTKEAEICADRAKADWEREQNRNLKYVAITRAKEELVYVR